MLRRTIVPSSLLVAVAVMVAWRAASPARGGEPVVQVTQALALSTPTLAEPSFTGSASCKKCHLKEHKSWADKKHGKAFDTLKAGQAKEAKEKFKLDPNKDYTKDEKCLKCHTVGFGKAGGYAIPKEGDEASAKAAAKLENVGCESCHGPGSEYLKVFEEIQKTDRKYKLDELKKVGLIVPDEATCKSCHNAEGPTHDASKPFDFAKMKTEGVHEIIPLKLREG